VHPRSCATTRHARRGRAKYSSRRPGFRSLIEVERRSGAALRGAALAALCPGVNQPPTHPRTTRHAPEIRSQKWRTSYGRCGTSYKFAPLCAGCFTPASRLSAVKVKPHPWPRVRIDGSVICQIRATRQFGRVALHPRSRRTAPAPGLYHARVPAWKHHRHVPPSCLSRCTAPTQTSLVYKRCCPPFRPPPCRPRQGGGPTPCRFQRPELWPVMPSGQDSNFHSGR
jgi:hypothetical protein